MRETTKKGKKSAPIICAALVIIFMGALLAFFLYPLFSGLGGTAVAGILIAYALFIGAVIVGVAAALRERLREIKNGEEDEAKKY